MDRRIYIFFIPYLSISSNKILFSKWTKHRSVPLLSSRPAHVSLLQNQLYHASITRKNNRNDNGERNQSTLFLASSSGCVTDPNVNTLHLHRTSEKRNHIVENWWCINGVFWIGPTHHRVILCVWNCLTDTNPRLVDEMTCSPDWRK